MVSRQTIKNYGLVRDASGCGYKVKNLTVIRAYLNNRYKWYTNNFLNAKHKDKSEYVKQKLAENFINGFIAEEIVHDYLNEFIYHPMDWTLAFTEEGSRYSYTTEAKENWWYTKPDYKLWYGTEDSNEINAWKYVECKSGKDDKPSESKFKSTHGANNMVYLSYGDPLKIELSFWTKVDGKWIQSNPLFDTSYIKTYNITICYHIGLEHMKDGTYEDTALPEETDLFDF